MSNMHKIISKLSDIYSGNRIYIILNVIFLLVLTLLLKLTPVHNLSLTLSDSTHLSLIHPESRVSLQRPVSSLTGATVFKKIGFRFPMIMRTSLPDVRVRAYTIGREFKYIFYIGKKVAGELRVKPYLFRISEPKLDKSMNFDGSPLHIKIYDYLKPWENRPRLYIRELNITPSDKDGFFQRGWSYILPLLGFCLIFQIIGLAFRRPLYLKFILASAANITFAIIGLLSTTVSFVLQTIFLPVLISMLVVFFSLFLLIRKKVLDISFIDVVIIILIFTIGLTFWLAFTFHPSHYHPDLKTHIKWSLAAENQSILDFSNEYSYFQMSALLLIQAPFPYSPSFYLAIKALSINNAHILFWVRFLPVLMTMLLMPFLYIVVRRITSARLAAAAASVVFIFNGIMALRILYFFYPALWGYFFISLTTLFLVFRSNLYKSPRKIKRLLPEILLVTIAFVAYPSGPFALGMMFLVVLIFAAIFARREKDFLRNWTKIFVPAILLANILYYAWYIPDIITKVLPRLREFSAAGWGAIRESSVLGRVEGLLSFYLIIFAALAGFILLLQKLKGKTCRNIILGWGIAWAILFTARYIPVASTLFKFSKDALFLLPLFSISLGYLIDFLWKRKAVYRSLAITVGLLLAGGFYIKILMLLTRTFIQ